MALEKLHKVLDDIVKKNNYINPTVAVNPISTGGANYSSSLYTIIVSESGKEDLQLFAKVLVTNENLSAQLPMKIVDLEQFFYVDLLKKYENIQNAHNLPVEKRLIVPKYYGCYPKEPVAQTIVLENLTVKGFTTHDRFKSIDWDYAAKAMESLAKFHALSMAYSENNPVEFEQVVEKIKGNGEMIAGILKRMYQQHINTTLAVIPEKHKNKLQKYLDTEVNTELMFKNKSLQRPILCHGDYRPSNLMHRVNENGALEVIPVDFQTIQYNSPLYDLMYFIFTGSDEKFRREHFQDLTDHYYQELSNALRSLKLNPDVIYPKTTFELELKEYLPYGLVTAIYSLPIITVETENAPVIRDDASIEVYDSFLQTKTGPLYPERMNGVINDFFRWGIIE
ncbi:uncharacterized protein LOC113515760 [Galleria mellonella]|uniref:Uncharacterized protein LOC113515760 n=1 Tax=Galleria mellonella TaxID=7137 RepID=A0ABM3MWG8_GALME|nr:uncharacterized protein LOC113515760 [Galleria mellonella]